MLPTSWVEAATATAGIATATKAAKTTGSHVLSCVIASYSDPTISGTLTITITVEGTAESLVHYVHGADVVPLELRGDTDTAVVAALASGGGAVVGKVIMVGSSEG